MSILLLQKGVYGYCYIDDWNKLNESHDLISRNLAVS